jgi:DNA-directed RNA polymerase specialized sigma24 family protein
VNTNLSHWSDERLLQEFSETGRTEVFEILYRRYVDNLKRWARHALRQRPRDEDDVEEIAERVFLRLHRHRETLAGFDPQRWIFPVFLAQLLKDEIRVQFRKHKRKSARQLGDCYEDEGEQKAARECYFPVYLAEFAASLKGAEKRYWNEILLAQPGTPAHTKPLSESYVRKLKQRVERRWTTYWSGSGNSKSEKIASQVSHIPARAQISK